MSRHDRSGSPRQGGGRDQTRIGPVTHDGQAVSTLGHSSNIHYDARSWAGGDLIASAGTASLRNEILFRDRLRRDRTAATEYEALKRALAKHEYHDPHGYSRAKSDFVVTIVDEERAARGLPPVDIWITLGPVRKRGWLEIEGSSPPGGPI
jgi:hypothetical protein